MKKIAFCSTVCFLFSFPALAFGATGMYGTVHAGVAMLPDSHIDVTLTGGGYESDELPFDTGFSVGGALGYMMNKFRVEGEISYLKSNIDSLSDSDRIVSINGDISALTFLANGYFDFFSGRVLTPYLTAGIGYSNVEIDLDDKSNDDNLLTYQLGIGVGYAISEKLSVDFRYRYVGFQNFEYSEAGTGSLDADIASYTVMVGLRKVLN